MQTNKITFKREHLGRHYRVHITKPANYEVTIFVAEWLFNNELERPGFDHKMHGLSEYEKSKVKDITVTAIVEVGDKPKSVFKRF